MKRLLALVMASVLTFSLAACTGKPTGDGTAQNPEDKRLTIGYACPNLNNTFQTYLVEEAKKYAAANNMDIVVVDGQQDVVIQQDQVNAFIQQEVDGIVVCPADTSAMAPVTAAAAEAGIPLVYLNTNPYPDGKLPENVYYIGSQEYEGGVIQGNYVGEKLGGKGNVAILMGGLTYEASINRSAGVKETIEKNFPDMKVLASETGDWQREKAMTVTENWITAYGKDLNAICANNDEMALGALKALQAEGRTDVLVLGIDAIPDAITSLEKGELSASVFQDSVGQGQGAMELAHKAILGETIAEPVIWVPFILVTKDNAAEFK